MKTYIINLDRNVDRLNSIKSRLGRFSIPCERFAAVRGTDLTSEDRRGSFAAVRSFFVMMRYLTPAELGCALSHVGVYKKIVENGEPFALVLEDDVCFSDMFSQVLELAVRAIDISRPQVILLSHLGINANSNEHQNGLERLRRGYGADAYLITLSAARNLILSNFPVVTVSDQWGRWVRRGLIELYRMWPITVWQDRSTFVSQIGLSFRRKPFVWRYGYKSLRVLGMLVDEVWYRMTKK